ncbi:MAG: transposase [Acidobacteria bacterium]|nr:transposase [Acidobacteriota bacterium]
MTAKHAAESLAALDLTGGEADFLARIDQLAVEALVIALCVIRPDRHFQVLPRRKPHRRADRMGLGETSRGWHGRSGKGSDTRWVPVPARFAAEGTGLRRVQRRRLRGYHAVGPRARTAVRPRAGRRIARVGDEVDPVDGVLPSGPCCASVAGFSVHAGVRVTARDRLRLERLARYAGRPALATGRLSLLPDGRLLYRLKHRWRDGTTHVICEPLELIERLAALVPPPRFNITRYYGVFAPAAAFRPRVTPEPEASSPPPHPGCQAAVQASEADRGKTKGKRGCRPRNYPWATLMERVFGLDVLACPRCGARMRILAAINPPAAIEKILACLGLPARAPPTAPPAAAPDTAHAW